MTHTNRWPVIALAFVVIVLLVAVTGCAVAPAPTAEPSPTPEVIDIAATDPSIGPANARVTIQEYADFSCPSCAVWARQGVREKLIEKYGDKIRFVWHDYAVLSPQSRPSAEAARCAEDQGKFWEYHDVLFENYPDLEISDLKKYAADLGLDTATFNACLDTEKNFDKVKLGLRDGIDHGFFATPGFLVNDKRVFGGQSQEVFEKVINPFLGALE